MNGKKLYRSDENKMLAGVCGGIAEYFGVDPTLIRLAWVVFSLLGGSGLLAISSPRSSSPATTAISINKHKSSE